MDNLNYKRNKEHSNPLELGSATLFAILFTLGLISLYKYGKPYLDAISPILFSCVLICMTILCVVSCLYAFHSFFMGDKSTRSRKKELNEESQYVHDLIQSTISTIEKVEEDMLEKGYRLTPKSIECMTTARRIVMALEKRNDKVKNLIKSSNNIKIIEAYSLIHSPLTISRNSLDSLIDADPIPAIEYNDLEFTLNNLFKKVETEINLVMGNTNFVRKNANR